MLKITVLGCGASVGVPALRFGWGDCDPSNPKNYRLRSSILIQNEDTSLLVDMSPDLRHQFLKYGTVEPDGVFVTHEHFDHTQGMNEFRTMFFDKKEKLQIYAAPEVVKILKKMFFYLFEDSGVELYKPYVVANEVSDKFSVGSLDCECFEQSHGYIKSHGIRVGDFAYSTDVVSFPESSFKKLYGLDTWIVGCLAYEKKSTHADFNTVLEWISELKPKRAFLTHMSSFMDYDTLLKKLPPNVFPAYDGLVIRI